jgi:hypothetical protein
MSLSGERRTGIVNVNIIPDSLADALGRVVVNFERQQETRAELWQARAEALLTRLEVRERDIEAEIKEGIETRFSALLERLERTFLNRDESFGEIIAERIASIRDGERGPPGERGAQGPPGERGETGEAGPPGEPGERGEAGSEGQQGKDGRDGVDGRDGLPGVPGRDGRDGADGAQGERGERGEVGERGEDGKSFVHRGTHDPAASYQMGDVVVRDSSSFVAVNDNPGPMENEDGTPGSGWRLIAGKGKRGERGEPGRPGRDGLPGKNGRNGASFIGLRQIDGLRGAWIRDDGEEVEVDMEPFFRAYHEQVTR